MIVSSKLPVIIIGTGLVARQVAEILNQQDFVVYGFLSLHPGRESLSALNDIPVLGALQDLTFQKLLKTEQIHFIVADTEPTIVAQESVKITELTGNQPISAIHQQAILSPSLTMGVGNIIYAGTVAGPNCDLASFIQLGAGCVLEGDCQIDSRSVVASKAAIGSGVVIEEDVYIGSGAVIAPGIRIGKAAKIAPGSVVISSVPANVTVFGNPATELKSKKT